MALHRIRVDLAHVPGINMDIIKDRRHPWIFCLPAFVRLLDVPNPHGPSLVLGIGDANALVFGYYMILNR